MIDRRRLLGLDFEAPEILETEEFRLRMLTVNDLVKDYDVAITMWVRESELAGGLDRRLFRTVKSWVASEWPFSNPAYPGRDIPVAAWHALGDKQ